MGAIIRDMRDDSYDFAVVNKYDIETSAAIKQVSDISAKSIFSQLQLQESDYADMVKIQAEELVRLREELSNTKEQLRMWREKGLKQELLIELEKELKMKGIKDSDIKNIISSELLISNGGEES